MIAPVFRNQIRLRAAILELSGLTAQLNADLGRGGRVEIKPTSVTFAVELHSVEERAIVGVMPAVNDRVAVHGIDVAANVLRRGTNGRATVTFAKPPISFVRGSE